MSPTDIVVTYCLGFYTTLFLHVAQEVYHGADIAKWDSEEVPASILGVVLGLIWPLALPVKFAAIIGRALRDEQILDRKRRNDHGA